MGRFVIHLTSLILLLCHSTRESPTTLRSLYQQFPFLFRRTLRANRPQHSDLFINSFPFCFAALYARIAHNTPISLSTVSLSVSPPTKFFSSHLVPVFFLRCQPNLTLHDYTRPRCTKSSRQFGQRAPPSLTRLTLTIRPDTPIFTPAPCQASR